MAGAITGLVGAPTGGSYTWQTSADGGTNYFKNGQPITREVYGANAPVSFGDRMTGGDISNQTLPSLYNSPTVDYGPMTMSDGSTPNADGQYSTYAQQQAAANAQLRAGFANQKSNIYGSANDAATALQGGYNQSIQDTIHNLTVGQQGIDRKNVQNESSRIQGGRDIMSMVGQGIKSGGVTLANKNAGQSSAAQAIADAYSQLGQQQMSTVGNQYSSNAGDIAVAQDEQNYQVGQAPGKFHEGLMQNVNAIVSAARDKFAQLDASMADASLPDRIAIEQEKESVRQQVLGHLQQYDAQLSQGVSGIKAADRNTNVSNANSQLAAGQADPNLFKYTTEAPTSFQNTGPAASELPIYTYKNKTQLA